MGAIAVRVDEEALVREAIGGVEPPEGVRLRQVNVDYVDSTGDLAVQVIFAVKKSIPLTKKRVVQLSRFKRAVAERISSLDLQKWPFVNFAETR